MSPIRTLGDRTTNAQAIRDAHLLGYIDGQVLDCTYGLGRFWRDCTPRYPTFCDVDPAKSPIGYGVDFTAMPEDWAEKFDTVVFDPPYKYSGTASNVGPAALNADYGIAEYMSSDKRDELIWCGMKECERVLAPGGHLLVKCQDQVVSGRKRWQRFGIICDATMNLSLTLVDEFLVQSYRAQPKGRSQKHSRIDFSNLLVFKKCGAVYTPRVHD